MIFHSIRFNYYYICAHVMLHSDKTFIDQGVENGAEIVITGGRL